MGSWVEDGGYWLITQNQAHSWVEYVDADAMVWTTIDPTPPGAVSYHRRWRLAEKLSNTMDAMRFRWDRYVVRYSDDEQMKGISWAQSKLARLKGLKPNTKTIASITIGGAVLLLLVLIWKKRGGVLLAQPPSLPSRI